MKVVLAIAAATSVAHADPYQLRASALATTSAPAGLLSLATDAALGSNASAEAVVWTGGGTLTSATAPSDVAHAQVLVIAVRAHTRGGRAGVRIGRFVESIGALRPVQIDGGAVLARLPYRLDVETFAGVPVAPEAFARGRAWDWMTGGRVARRIGDAGSIGVAYAEQRDAGRLAMEELGVDAGAALGKRDDVAGKVAYDLANPGVAEASVTASHRFAGSSRVDVFAGYRAASHLLPATSLFSVLGDVPAERAGASLLWRAAPRLDVALDAAARRADGATDPELALRAKLRLDDRGVSALSAELRRDGVGDDTWTGARAAARIALPRVVVGAFASTELELVVPDHPAPGTGRVWPWALAAVGWDDGTWQAAIACEAAASPEDVHRVDALVQLSRRWSAP